MHYILAMDEFQDISPFETIRRTIVLSEDDKTPIEDLICSIVNYEINKQYLKLSLILSKQLRMTLCYFEENVMETFQTINNVRDIVETNKMENKVFDYTIIKNKKYNNEELNNAICIIDICDYYDDNYTSYYYKNINNRAELNAFIIDTKKNISKSEHIIFNIHLILPNTDNGFIEYNKV